MAHSKLTDRYRRNLKPGEQVQENGIRYRARENGDGTWFINYRDGTGKVVTETLGRSSDGITLETAQRFLMARNMARVPSYYEQTRRHAPSETEA